MTRTEDTTGSVPGACEWLALHRVHEGGIGKCAGVYFEHGRPAPGQLNEMFDRLVWTGLVAVAEGDPLWSLRPLSLTPVGQARYATLCAARHAPRQRVELPVPPAQFRTPPAETPAGRRASAASLAPPGDRPVRGETSEPGWSEWCP